MPDTPELRFVFRDAITGERLGEAKMLLPDLAMACATTMPEIEPGAHVLQVHITFVEMFSTRFGLAIDKEVPGGQE